VDWSRVEQKHWFNPIPRMSEKKEHCRRKAMIIYHASIVLRPAMRPSASSPEELLKEVLSGYDGEAVVGRDLDVYSESKSPESNGSKVHFTRPAQCRTPVVPELHLSG
jgi:hypothetical protein